MKGWILGSKWGRITGKNSSRRTNSITHSFSGETIRFSFWAWLTKLITKITFRTTTLDWMRTRKKWEVSWRKVRRGLVCFRRLNQPHATAHSPKSLSLTNFYLKSETSPTTRTLAARARRFSSKNWPLWKLWANLTKTATGSFPSWGWRSRRNLNLLLFWSSRSLQFLLKNFPKLLKTPKCSKTMTQPSKRPNLPS